MSTLSRTVAERVTDALRARILAGGYPPGAPLRQDAVAAELGVSRIPLREALNHLQAEGLVQGIAHRGFVVRKASALGYVAGKIRKVPQQWPETGGDFTAG